jgi:hypothetical protein
MVNQCRALPGVPGFPHFGHNGRVAWCVTHAFIVSASLPHGTLRIVAHGTKEDGGTRAAVTAGQIL